MGLLKKDQMTVKPQNRFSQNVVEKARELVKAYLKEFGLSDYQSHLLAEDLVEKARKAWVEATAHTAPDVHFTDKQQLDRLERKAIQIANLLDEKNELEQVLADLEIADAQNEGNSL